MKLWNGVFDMLWSSGTCPSWINGQDFIVISHIAFSTFLWYCFLPLQVAICETPKWRGINGPNQPLIWRLRSFRDFGTPVIGVLDISISRFSKLRNDVNLLTSHVDWHVSNNCHVSLWLVTYMCLKCWISLTLVIAWLCHVFLGLLTCLVSGFHISALRDS